MLKPAMIQLSVAMPMILKFFPDFNPAEAMDNYIQQYATDAGKSIIGLETIDDQINALFYSSSLKRQSELLLCSFENMEYSYNELIVELVNAYNQADLTTLLKMFDNKESPCPPTQEEVDAMLKNRNDRWIEKLPAIMSDKSSFIAVGAGHLVGEVGLLEQLEKLGYQVEPVLY